MPEEIARTWRTPTEFVGELIAPGEGAEGGRVVREMIMGDLDAYIAGDTGVVPGVEDFKFVDADRNELKFPIQLIFNWSQSD